MQLKPAGFSQHLKQGLASVYFITGDEPLQRGEAVDEIRKKARSAGFLNRQILHVEARFDWNQLRSSVLSQSLFAEKNLIELNIPTAKPGRDGSAAIVDVIEQLGNDNLLIIIAGKMDAKSKSSRWFKAIDSKGIILPVWPIEGHELTQWVITRLQKKNLQITADAAKLLAERVEGNLLMANQEVEKLHVLYGEGQLGTNEILSAVADNARYDVFKLADSLLAGNLERSIKMLAGLQQEKIASPVVLWVFTREIRLLAELAMAKQQRKSSDVVFRNNRVWDTKKTVYLKAVSRSDYQHWLDLLQKCSELDKTIKGAAIGDEWVLFEQLCIAICQPQNTL